MNFFLQVPPLVGAVIMYLLLVLAAVCFVIAVRMFLSLGGRK